MGNSAKRDARKADKAERRRKALELRKAGASYEQIASQLGYTNRGSVWRDVREAIQDIYREPAQDVLVIELQRLDVMLLGLWQKAKSGDTQAIDRVLRIQERRAAYLGIDAPKRNEHSGKDGGPILTVDLDSLSEQQLEAFSRGGFAALAGASAAGTPPAATGGDGTQGSG